MSLWTLAIIVFVIDSIVAFAWTECVRAVSENRAVKAGMWSGFITLCGAVTIISYMTNSWLLLPAILGSAVGTYFSVKLKRV